MNSSKILQPNWKEMAHPVESRIRRYDNVYYYKKNNVSYVIKSIGKKEIAILTYLKPLSFVLQPLEILQERVVYWAVFPRHDDVLWGQNNETFYSKTVKKLAILHDFTSKNPIDLRLTHNEYQKELSRIQNLLKKYSYTLPINFFENITCLISAVNIEYHLIHDDFLPFNVLITKDNEITFIDFEHAIFDFAERDIGRFLSDINPFEGTVDYVNNRYYPQGLYAKLKETYLRERLLLNPKYNIPNGEKKILLAEIWNYLTVIDACITKGDGKSKWVKMNIDAVQTLVTKNLF